MVSAVRFKVRHYCFLFARLNFPTNMFFTNFLTLIKCCCVVVVCVVRVGVCSYVCVWVFVYVCIICLHPASSSCIIFCVPLLFLQTRRRQEGGQYLFQAHALYSACPFNSMVQILVHAFT